MVWRWVRFGLAALLPVAATSAAAPPLTAYGQLPGISNIEVSPDGSKWAAILGNEIKAEIQIRELATSKLLSATPIERAKARSRRCHVNCGWPELGLQAAYFNLRRSRHGVVTLSALPGGLV